MSKPRLADLFSCAGGAGRGYQLAGFHVTGFDIKAQPRYAGDAFEQRDVLSITPEELRARFDAIHASPPCQAHSALKHVNPHIEHPDLIPEARALLKASGLPWIMENVAGAPLKDPVMLCGSMFGLGTGEAELQRHRLFETSWPILFVPQCQHGSRAVIGIYGGHVRNRKRQVVSVASSHTWNPKNCASARKARGHKDKGLPDFSVADGRVAMGIEWMTQVELGQAIPPAYTEWLGRELLNHMNAERQAA